MELGKAPTMETALRFRVLLHLGTGSDMRQVLNHDGTARGGIVHNAFAEDVIVVFALPKQFARELLEMSFCALGAFGLELSSEAEDASFLFLPSSLTQEMFRGRDRRAIETQVNANDFTGRSNNGIRQRDDDVKRPSSFIKTEISRTDLAADVLGSMGRNGKRELHPSLDSSKATGHRVPLDPVGTLVIADRTELCMGGTYLTTLLLAIQSRLDGFRRLHTGRTHQLRRQVRMLPAQIVVGLFMQFHAVAALELEAQTGDGIKAACVLHHRAMQSVFLLWRGIQLYNHRSVHMKSYIIYTDICQ